MIEDKEDFFEKTPEEKPKKVKVPKAPRLKPDDPRYYDREDGRWDHLKPSPYRRGPIFWIIGLMIVIAIALVATYRYFFVPVVDEATEFGYVENIQKEGSFFPSFEGVLLPYKSLMDTLRPYAGDFAFSTSDEHLAAELKRRQGLGVPVKIEFKIFRHRLPWRGQTRVIVTKVDSVNPEIILPPDRHPEHLSIIAAVQAADSMKSSDQK